MILKIQYVSTVRNGHAKKPYNYENKHSIALFIFCFTELKRKVLTIFRDMRQSGTVFNSASLVTAQITQTLNLGLGAVKKRLLGKQNARLRKRVYYSPSKVLLPNSLRRFLSGRLGLQCVLL